MSVLFGLIINEQINIWDIQREKCLEQEQSYKYLGSIVNGDNSIGDEIKERTALGNKAYYANQKIFKGYSVSKNPN
jgi:hypothetical protein